VKSRGNTPWVVHMGGGTANLKAKNGQKLMKMVEIGPRNHENYCFLVREIYASCFRERLDSL
jgi:hypothetical protein